MICNSDDSDHREGPAPSRAGVALSVEAGGGDGLLRSLHGAAGRQHRHPHLPAAGAAVQGGAGSGSVGVALLPADPRHPLGAARPPIRPQRTQALLPARVRGVLVRLGGVRTRTGARRARGGPGPPGRRRRPAAGQQRGPGDRGRTPRAPPGRPWMAGRGPGARPGRRAHGGRRHRGHARLALGVRHQRARRGGGDRGGGAVPPPDRHPGQGGPRRYRRFLSLWGRSRGLAAGPLRARRPVRPGLGGGRSDRRRPAPAVWLWPAGCVPAKGSPVPRPSRLPERPGLSAPRSSPTWCCSARWCSYLRCSSRRATPPCKRG